MIMVVHIYDDVDDDIDDQYLMFGIILFVFLTAMLERAMDRRKKNAKTVRPAIHHRSHYWLLHKVSVILGFT